MQLAKWWCKLDQRDHAHLQESMTGTITLAKFKSTWQYQVEHGIECHECRRIARRLGLKGDWK